MRRRTVDAESDRAPIARWESATRVLIGAVGYRWQSDASFGFAVCDALSSLEWPETVEIADLGYSALYVAQDLAAAEPPYDRLILISGATRGRRPGQVYYRRWTRGPLDPEDVQARIREAGGGVVDLDHLLAVGDYFEALPAEVFLVEAEPVITAGGEELTQELQSQIPPVIQHIRESI